MSLIGIRMPKWGLSMQEGTITAWHVAPGQLVERGAELCDIETAKITNAFEAPASGVVAQRLAEAGEVVGVGRLIAVLSTAGEDPAQVAALVEAERQAAPEAVTSPSAPALRQVLTSAGPIAYADEGDPASPPVVLLHGFGGDHSSWLLVQGALAAGCRVLAFDLPGHGASTRLVGDGSAAALAAPLGEALDALSLGPVHLVAHSFGALVGRALAERRPVTSASLIAPAGFGAPVDPEYMQRFAAARRKRDLRPLMERLFARPEALGRDMVSMALALLDDPAARDALRRIADRLAAEDAGQPTWPGDGQWQILWGTADHIIAMPDWIAAALGHRLHRLGDTGHLPHLEQPTRVAALLLTLLANDVSPPGHKDC